MHIISVSDYPSRFPCRYLRSSIYRYDYSPIISLFERPFTATELRLCHHWWHLHEREVSLCDTTQRGQDAEEREGRYPNAFVGQHTYIVEPITPQRWQPFCRGIVAVWPISSTFSSSSNFHHRVPWPSRRSVPLCSDSTPLYLW
jgi:hypothetical protein